MARGAVVVILSDGWDRGDPVELAEQMQRLDRVAHRVVWVNPLKVTPGYAPLARGMAAALPYVDRFVEGHSLGALERLADDPRRGVSRRSASAAASTTSASRASSSSSARPSSASTGRRTNFDSPASMWRSTRSTSAAAPTGTMSAEVAVAPAGPQRRRRVGRDRVAGVRAC